MSRWPWSVTLFLAALAVLWGGLLLSGMLFPERQDKRVYDWPANAEAVRRVVVDVRESSDVVALAWTPDAAPRVEAAEAPYSPPALALVVEGDTLFLRRKPQAAPGEAEAPPRQGLRRVRGIKLFLPLAVHWVQASELTLVGDSPVPPRLTLAGQSLTVDSHGLANRMESLHLLGLGARCPNESGSGHARVSVVAARIDALQIGMTGGSLGLSDIGHLPGVDLRAPGDTSLRIDHLLDLPKLQRLPWTPESDGELRAQAVRQAPTEEEEPTSGCLRPRIRMKETPVNAGG